MNQDLGRLVVVPAAYLYCLRGDTGQAEVLLQLRQRTGYMDGYWAAAAAGHIERGETAWDALQREAAEELGITVTDPTFAFTMHRTQGGAPIDERVDFFFTARQWYPQPRIMEPDKCADLRWWPLGELPELIVAHEAAALAALEGDAGYLTYGF